MSNRTHPPGFLEEIAPWIRGKKLAIYLRGRPKPWTGLIIKYVGHSTIVARWNSSTHLIPRAAIDGIRFAPDCDPCRDTQHSLHLCMSSRSGVPPQTPPKPYRKEVAV